MPWRASQVSGERTYICGTLARRGDAGRASSSSMIVVALDDDLAGRRVDQIARPATRPTSWASRSVAPRRLGQVVDPDAVLGAAVVLVDDHVLRHVDQAPGQVARVGGSDGGVGQTLAGAVRREEVLEHGQALAEVRADRQLDDPTRRVGHQAAHAGHLRDLLDVALGARLGHHVDRAVTGRARSPPPW